MKTINTSPDKAEQPALFGLLVIPVDFADARVGSDWDRTSLTNRLTSTGGQSLTRYFNAASRGRLDLRITQAPMIHLPGTRRDYSDIHLNGFTRTRALATESLQAVRDLGLEFRRLDMEGPDRTPGTDDDDGEVDGVLILHAGIGQENDPEDGLVQALQFFLEEPITSQGIHATFYAVASLHSGPGIWAHETAHLLGLEDRYDPGLRPAGGSEVLSRGGLGRFSLMGSGAWGTGDGYGAALPDAYSSLQMGWYDSRNLAHSVDGPDTLRPGLVSGLVDRVWTRSEFGPEFFLLETRDPAAAFPFDADIPGNHLLVYHVDESLPEGSHAVDGENKWHLRVSLVEADADFKLLRGEDAGREADLFPGPLGKTDFDPGSVPSSDGYNSISFVRLNDISPIPGGMTYRTSVWPTPNIDFTSGFHGETDLTLALAARSTGTPVADLRCTVTAVSNPTWGTFAGGQTSVAFDLVEDGNGQWRPDSPVTWVPVASVPANGQTRFRYDFEFDGGLESETRNWVWKDNAGVLDFAVNWPGGWSISNPGENPNTFWHRWNTGPPWLTEDRTPVLACTGFEFFDSSAWPVVTYQNSGYVKLTSGELGPDVRAVRLIHAMEVEFLTANVAMDGGVAVWIDSQNREYPAEPLAGWRGRISDKAVNPLHGQGALIHKELELTGDIPLWRTDIIPVPPGLPGPWRLRLAFGSNTLWRQRGWFVADVEAITSEPADAAFTGEWISGQGAGLSWHWPWKTGTPQGFVIEHRVDEDGPWTDMIRVEPAVPPGDDPYFIPAADILPLLGGARRNRHALRIVGSMDKGLVATREIVVFPDGGDGKPVTLGIPWPNPTLDSIRFLVDIPAGVRGTWSIYDLQGRLVRKHGLGAGSHLLEWDGRDSQGGRAASGTYFLRLEGSGAAVMRKVVLLH
ncbi:MAG: immune inhibitor A domain-containing protein [Candidatus Krumholzibacteriota bacterium]